ncbi:MAG: hypothetical protein H2172_06645 [Opitutus sp.]|nr:hypothetical protein [Opitutus sp.]MCS6246196.1 hypothetical protein [Opitutus sp.]MCS6275025.1 hypothetical protein [Opitutus sp.]MCS6278535.1 hypothetical protein [Opitutus sp.]MCS6300063.1 hypothetical protein [Opitutus sp.]
MNKLFVSLLWVVCAFVPVGLAEEFNGTMQWSARIEFLDPQMDMVQSAMKNPEVLAMLLQNPQLRGMLESKLGPLNANSGATSLFPTGGTLFIKGQRALVKTEGGLVSREVLSMGDQRTAYSLNRPARTYQKIADSAASGAGAAVKTKVTRTKDTAVILGYACNRFLVEADDAGAKSHFSVWTTTAIKGLDAAALKRLSWGQAGAPDFLGKIEGVPLKIDAVTPDAKVGLVATRITVGPVEGALFVLPAAFKQVASD